MCGGRSERELLARLQKQMEREKRERKRKRRAVRAGSPSNDSEESDEIELFLRSVCEKEENCEKKNGKVWIQKSVIE